MAWSTRELADLAGTTVNTIRHYHRLGLMKEPEREYNGYKQYGVHDLVCLLRIRRLVDLGLPLSQIGDVSADGEDSTDALLALDAELAASATRIEQARADIAAILRDKAPADSPAGFESVASRMSQADQSIIHLYGRFYDDQAMKDLRNMIEFDYGSDTVSAEIDALLPDADEATRQRLAESIAPTIARSLIEYPWLSDPAARSAKGAAATQETFVEAVVELYNPAQLDVLGRASILATEMVRVQRNGDA